MKKVQLIIPDLLPPQDWAEELLAGLKLPALALLLARGKREEVKSESLEAALCRTFEVSMGADGWPVAAVTARADGLPSGGYWLRADPVHFLLQRDKIVALPTSGLTTEEVTRMVDSLNLHFSTDGLTFHAPHPQRWYLRLADAPGIVTTPLSQVFGRDIRNLLPQGAAALRWHRLTNEIQMLLHQHPVNEALEARGLRAVNGVWLWGGGASEDWMPRSFQSIYTDDGLAEQFSRLTGLVDSGWPVGWKPTANTQLLVYGGLGEALQAGDWQLWRDRIQTFEQGYAQPLVLALRRRELSLLEIEVLRSAGDARRYTLTPASAWKFWRRGSLVRAVK